MDEAGSASSLTGRAPKLVKYELLGEVGHGATATVFRARDRRLGREVAVKVVHPHLRDSVEVRKRFSAEARTVAKLRHRNIVDVYDVSEEDEPEQYLVCELLSGTTLRHWLRERGSLPPEVAASIGAEVLEALAHAHGAGVIHRDVKPENVLVDVRADGAVSIKLADFGIAKILDAQGVTATAQVLGSPAHMAPEQIEAGDVDARSDVFGVGVLLYECMVGHLPFEGRNPAQVLRRVLDGRYPFAVMERPEVGKQWSALLDRALAPDMSLRFQSADEMRAAIVAELTRLGVSAPGELAAEWRAKGKPFDIEYAERMVPRLAKLAMAARSRGDALSAASDLNRALAYAPGNVEVRRLVATMIRRRVVGRGAIVGIGASVSVVLVLVARHFWPHAAPPLAEVAPIATPPEPPPSDNQAVALEIPDTAVKPSLKPSAVRERKPAHAPFTVAPVTAPPAGASAAASRTVSLVVRPPFGVFLSVDGAVPRAVQTGDRIRLDERPHALTFTCADDVCRSLERNLPAGSDDESVDARLVVKPATLIVDGDSAGSYVIRQRPGVVFHGSTPQMVSMDGKRELVTLESVERGKTRRVELIAGQTVHAPFVE